MKTTTRSNRRSRLVGKLMMAALGGALLAGPAVAHAAAHATPMGKNGCGSKAKDKNSCSAKKGGDKAKDKDKNSCSAKKGGDKAKDKNSCSAKKGGDKAKDKNSCSAKSGDKAKDKNG